MLNIATCKTRSIIGIQAKSVCVEVHLTNGLPQFNIVGLAETAIKESKDRVRSAIINSQFEFPCRKITVNLSPAALPKVGSGFDLPIALGILAASGQMNPTKLATHEFVGELSLDGKLRGITAVIPAILALQDDHTLIISHENAEEAALVGQHKVLLAENLREVCYYLSDESTLASPSQAPLSITDEESDWAEIKGQAHAKYALEIAASGGHSALLSGPPGSGKTMLARRFITLLPLLSETQAMECAAIHSIRGMQLNYQRWRHPSFRAPHHTASPIALVGGGSPPKPGEISLAHHGVLFLDELPEFNRHVLETLREPLESGSVSISRAAAHVEFPASFQLLAAMNPCPCGQWGNPNAHCICSPDRIKRYLGKLSAPLLDRIDMHIYVQPLSHEELLTAPTDVSESKRVRETVSLLRDRQLKRQGCLNAHLSGRQAESACLLGDTEKHFLQKVMHQLKLSGRGFHRLLKVARTLADRKNCENVSVQELQQALAFKQSLKTPI